jgi:hypothetical protein
MPRRRLRGSFAERLVAALHALHSVDWGVLRVVVEQGGDVIEALGGHYCNPHCWHWPALDAPARARAQRVWDAVQELRRKP